VGFDRPTRSEPERGVFTLEIDRARQNSQFLPFSLHFSFQKFNRHLWPQSGARPDERPPCPESSCDTRLSRADFGGIRRVLDGLPGSCFMDLLTSTKVGVLPRQLSTWPRQNSQTKQSRVCDSCGLSHSCDARSRGAAAQAAIAPSLHRFWDTNRPPRPSRVRKRAVFARGSSIWGDEGQGSAKARAAAVWPGVPVSARRGSP